MIFIKIKYLKYIFIYFIKIMVINIYSTAPILFIIIISKNHYIIDYYNIK